VKVRRPADRRACRPGAGASIPGAAVRADAMRMIGATGEDVSEPKLWIDVVEAAGGDHRQHDGGAVGATLAVGKGLVWPSQGDASQGALSAIVSQADPAIVEEAGEVGPASEYVVDRLQDLGGA